MGDLACCVAAGLPWLEPAPWETKPLPPFQVIQSPVMWIDFDNGLNRVDNRFEALGREYGIPKTAPLYYFSFPEPNLNASKTKDTLNLIDLVLDFGVKFLVIDNLGAISCGANENNSEMQPIMSNLRLISERTLAATNLIAHSGRQLSTYSNIRGYSGIPAAIDRGLYVKREPNSDIITVKSEKTRDTDVSDFGAFFTYKHRSGTNDLETARFYGLTVASSKETDQEIKEAILDVLKSLAGAGISQNKLIIEVKKTSSSGEKRIELVIKQLVANGTIKCKPGPRNSNEYSI
jgi:hypothetical protein